MLGIEQFTTKQDLHGKILACDTGYECAVKLALSVTLLIRWETMVVGNAAIHVLFIHVDMFNVALYLLCTVMYIHTVALENDQSMWCIKAFCVIFVLF